MTTGKRALIVDDSRSARIILSRMLEQNGLTVDTAESAEQALEYLQRSRPDVIFMDHLMPGMDGFQAVQVIKSDPLTATIPLLMYTSQEGELYVSQARALGAVGVLPKTVRPVDVSRILYQLHLLPDRRTRRTALFEGPAAAAAAAAEIAPGEAAMAAALAATGQQMALSAWKRGTGRLAARPTRNVSPGSVPAALVPPSVMALSAIAVSELQAGLRQSTQQLVTDQLAEQRRFMLATFEAFARRLTIEVRDTIGKLSVPAPLENSDAASSPAMVAGDADGLAGRGPRWRPRISVWQATVANQGLAQELIESRAATDKARADALVAAASATLAGPLPATLAPVRDNATGRPDRDGVRAVRRGAARWLATGAASRHRDDARRPGLQGPYSDRSVRR